MIKVNTFLPKQMHEALRKVADITGQTMSDIIRAAIKDRLLDEAKRLQSEQEALHTLVDHEPSSESNASAA